MRAKLPIGVADNDSLAWVVRPADPTCAVTALPCLSQPPPGAFVQACKVAVVDPVDAARTVMTSVAAPVDPLTGNARPVTGAGGAGGGAATCDDELAGGAACATAAAAAVDEVAGVVAGASVAALAVVGAALVAGDPVDASELAGESAAEKALDTADTDGVIVSATARGLIPLDAAITATAQTSTVPIAAVPMRARRARM